MQNLSAAIIVTAGAALVGSSQWCAYAIMTLKINHSIDIAHTGVTTGIILIVTGILGWAYTLLSRTDPQRDSESKAR